MTTSRVIRLAASAALSVLVCQSAVTRAQASDAWVVKKPGPETQVRKTPRDRGGVNPCLTEDPGFGAYQTWRRGLPTGQLMVPRVIRRRKNAEFDVMFHFHGHEAARKEWVRAMDGPVLVGVDLGTGSGPYESYFASPGAYRELLAATERVMALEMGVPAARARRVGLSAWSAGYGAIGRILAQPAGKRVDVVVLLDGLHSGYSARRDTLDAKQLAPFTAYAKEAAAGRRLMYVTHSSIIPPGYSSTTETANFLIGEVGGRPHPSKPRGTDPLGLDLISWFVKGGLHVRGYAGNGPQDHCAQIGVLRDVLRLHVARRWRG